MTLDERIAYWRARQKIAEKHGLHEEAKAALTIAEKLTSLRRYQTEIEREVCFVFEAMPIELHEGAE